MANLNVGSQFSTGNSTVNQLPVGATLRVSAQGELEIVSVPAPAPSILEAGDYFESAKHGGATVVRLTSRLNDLLAIARGDRKGVIFVADDDDNVVRSQFTN